MGLERYISPYGEWLNIVFGMFFCSVGIFFLLLGVTLLMAIMLYGK